MARNDAADEAAVPSRVTLEAIATRRCLTASYNRGQVRLAPHILYTRHGELYVDAVTLERDGQPPRERKLGSFKLSGLVDLAIADSGFEPDPLFDPAIERYTGETLFTV